MKDLTPRFDGCAGGLAYSSVGEVSDVEGKTCCVGIEAGRETCAKNGIQRDGISYRGGSGGD